MPSLKTIIKKHPNCFAVLFPKLRDAITNKPVDFTVLQTVLTSDAAEKALQYYESEGIKAVVLPTFGEKGKAPELEPRRNAQLFRCLLGKE